VSLRALREASASALELQGEREGATVGFGDELGREGGERVDELAHARVHGPTPKEGTYIVSGNLTLRGVTKPVTVELTKTGEGKDARGQERIGFEGSFTINRLDFGVNFMPEGLGKEVTVLVAISGVKT
jgi:hypothetical protein